MNKTPTTNTLAATLRTFTAAELANWKKLQGSPRHHKMTSLQAADAVLAARA